MEQQQKQSRPPEPWKPRPYQDYVKWVALGVVPVLIVSAEVNSRHYLLTHSTPPPHPPEPILAILLLPLVLLEIILGLLALPRWQGAFALVSVFLAVFFGACGL